MVATISLSLAACSSSKSIPDKDLVKIFHDAFLANAYINEELSGEDSLLIYEPILARYGYTVDDMRFTVQTIAQRKSSRLSDLVGEASQILNDEYKMYNYQLIKQFDGYCLTLDGIHLNLSDVVPHLLVTNEDTLLESDIAGLAKTGLLILRELRRIACTILDYVKFGLKS